MAGIIATGSQRRFDALPPQVLTKVLSHLPLRLRVRSARVCCLWQQALADVTSPVYINDEQLYRKRRQRRMFCFQGVLLSMASKFPNLRAVSIALHEDAFTGEMKPKIDITGQWLENLLTSCPHLKMMQVFLPGCAEEESMTIFGGRVLQLLGERPMEAFSISGVLLPDANSLATLIRSWPNARALRFDRLCLKTAGPSEPNDPDVVDLNGGGYFAPGSPAVLEALGELGQLQRLGLEKWLLRDADLLTFLPRLQHLKYLDVSGCCGASNWEKVGFLTDASMTLISKSCPQLQDLFLNHNRRVTSLGILAVLSALPLRGLQVVDTDISILELGQILAASPTLFSLHISDLAGFDIINGPALSPTYYHPRICVITSMAGLIAAAPQFEASIRRSLCIIREARRRVCRDDCLDFASSGWDFLDAVSPAELDRILALQPAGAAHPTTRVLGELEDEPKREEKECDTCGLGGSDGVRLMRCAQCRAVWYCSVECQRRDWKLHRQTCRPYRVARAQAAVQVGQDVLVLDLTQLGSA